MNKEKALLKNTTIVTIGKIGTQLISFFLLPLYTSMLSTAEYGTVDLLNTLVGLLVPILTFQLEQGIFRYLVDYREKKEEQKKVITSIIYFMIIQSVLYTVVFLVISRWINNEYKYFLATNLLATMFSSILLQISRGLGDNIKYAIGSFLSAVSTIILNVVLIAGFKMGAYGMLYGTLFGNIICIIYLVFSKKIYTYIRKDYYTKEYLTKIVKYSIPLVPNVISWWIVNASDRLIITYMMNIDFNGIYSAANKFSAVISTIYSVFNLTWTESAAININEDDKDEYFSKIFNITIKVFGSLCLGIIAFMPFVFSILINEKFIEAYGQIPVLMMAALFNTFVSFIGSIYIAKKLTKEIAKTSIMAAIINILINVILIKKIGLYAASLSTLIAYFAMFLYRYYDSRKYVKLKAEKMLVFSMSLLYIITTIVYYTNNMVLKAMMAVIVAIYALCINKKSFSFILQTVKQKILTK